MHALVIDNTIEAIGRLPNSARRLDTNDWVMGLATAPPDLVAATGWREVVDTARPADTATTTHDRSVEMVNGTPTVTWTARAKTTEEQAADTQQANRLTIEQALDQALVDLATILADTNANINANAAARIKTIARALRRSIRIQRNNLSGTD